MIVLRHVVAENKALYTLFLVGYGFELVEVAKELRGDSRAFYDLELATNGMKHSLQLFNAEMYWAAERLALAFDDMPYYIRVCTTHEDFVVEYSLRYPRA